MTLTGSDSGRPGAARQGVDTFFYIMGAPMLSVEAASLALGMRASTSATSRRRRWRRTPMPGLLNRPGICHGRLGAGHHQLITGVAHAFVDCTPVVALADRRRRAQRPRGLPGDRPARHAGALHQMVRRVHHAERIPELSIAPFARR